MPPELNRRQMLLAAIAGAASSTILAGVAAPASAETSGADAQIPDSALLEPEELAPVLQSGKDLPLVFQVGVRFLYEQAHIPGAEYIGATERAEGLKGLRHRVANLLKSQSIVIYCGCCPWNRCPNIRPAYQELHTMGFTHVKALHIAENFGTDWTDKGYPVEGDRQAAT